MVKPRIRHRLLTNRLFYAGLISLLSACGGGGDKPADTTADLTPQSVPATFSVATTLQSSTQRQINVVDLTSGTTVRSYDLAGKFQRDTAAYPSAEWDDWHVTTRNTVDTDGLGYNAQGVSQLTFIQQHKVMQLDLNTNTVGVAKQISSVTDACSIDRNDVYMTGDGQHVWLRVETAGADANCASGSDNQTVLISSEMSALDAGIASGQTSGLTLIAALRDTSSAQQPKGLLVLNRDTSTLSVYDNKLKTSLYNVAVSDHMLLPTEVVRNLHHSPTNRYQALIQLGASLYLADWHAPQLQLGRPIATADATVNNPVSIVDVDTFYLGFGNRGLAINATTGAQIADATFPAGSGAIDDAWPTTSGVVVKQSISAPTTLKPLHKATTMWFLRKSDGTYKGLVGSSPSSEIKIKGVHGDTIFFSQTSDTLSSWLQLLKINVDGTPAVPIATGVVLVDQVQTVHNRPGTDHVTQLTWCEPTSPAAATGGCASSKLVAYNLATAKPTTLGTLAVSDGSLSSTLYSAELTWVGRNSLIMLVHNGHTGNPAYVSSELWMFNPDTANSLTTVSTVTNPL